MTDFTFFREKLRPFFSFSFILGTNIARKNRSFIAYASSRVVKKKFGFAKKNRFFSCGAPDIQLIFVIYLTPESFQRALKNKSVSRGKNQKVFFF